MSEKYYLGIDVGGTAIKYGVLNSEGKFIEKNQIPTEQTRDKFLSALLSLIFNIREKHTIDGIAFSFPGFIDYKKGYLITAGALTFLEKFNLKEFIMENTGLNCEVENDVNTVAMAEKWNGNAKDLTDFLCITIGTGIGGAIVIKDELHRGMNFSAGEFGFMITKGIENNIPEECGLSRNSAMYPLREKYSLKFDKSMNEVTGEEVFNSEEPYAKWLVENMLENLSIGLYNLFYILNPRKILIGGAISKREDLLPRMNDKLKVLFSKNKNFINYEIEKCYHENDAGVIGAVYHYINMTK